MREHGHGAWVWDVGGTKDLVTAGGNVTLQVREPPSELDQSRPIKTTSIEPPQLSRMRKHVGVRGKVKACPHLCACSALARGHPKPSASVPRYREIFCGRESLGCHAHAGLPQAVLVLMLMDLAQAVLSACAC